MQDVVITGYGVISPIGNSVDEFERRMFAGESGIKNLRGTIVADDFPVPFGAVVDDSTLPTLKDLGIENSTDTTKVQASSIRYGILSAIEALDYIPKGLELDGIVCGISGSIYFEYLVRTFQNGYNPEEVFWEQTCSEFFSEKVVELIKKRDNGSISSDRIYSLNSACATGNHIVGNAYQMLRTGRWKRCFVGAVEASEWMSSLMNFHMLNALNTKDVPANEASCPFSADRAGFVKSEAAACFIMETRESAEKRGAKILAEVKGFGLSSDAYRLTDGREDGLAVQHAMKSAIRGAGIEPSHIDYINAHGTSTPLNDRLETAAIKSVFGEKAYEIPVSSLKSQIGHSTVAAGAVEVLACSLMLQRQKIAPTIPNESRKAKINYILNNNLGFGGQNACVVLKRARA